MASYIGVDIGGTKISAIRMQGNDIEKRNERDTGAGRSLTEILETLEKTIGEVWSDDVRAIGMGVPGILDVEAGKIIQINNIAAFNGFELKKHIEKRFSVPAFVNNDANCFVLSEAFFGAGKPYSNVIGITLGTGVGGGIVIGKKVYSGNLGAAGEFGCMPYLDSTYEEYCGSRFFESRFGLSGKAMFGQAAQGDESALKAFLEYGDHLGKLLTQIMFFIAPEVIVIGGSISGAYRFFEPSIQKMLDEFSIPVIARHVTILPAELKESGVLGAAALSMSHMPV